MRVVGRESFLELGRVELDGSTSPKGPAPLLPYGAQAKDGGELPRKPGGRLCAATECVGSAGMDGSAGEGRDRRRRDSEPNRAGTVCATAKLTLQSSFSPVFRRVQWRRTERVQGRFPGVCSPLLLRFKGRPPPIKASERAGVSYLHCGYSVEPAR